MASIQFFLRVDVVVSKRFVFGLGLSLRLQLSRTPSLKSIEPWRPRDVRRAGRPPPRRAARGSRPGVRPSAVPRRAAARSAVPAGASPRRVAMTPKPVVRILGRSVCVVVFQVLFATVCGR